MYLISIFSSEYWERRFSVLVKSKTYFRYFHFIFDFKIRMKLPVLLLQVYIFGLTLG